MEMESDCTNTSVHYVGDESQTHGGFFYSLALKETIFRALCHRAAAAEAENGRFTPGMSQQSGDAYSSDRFLLSDCETALRGGRGGGGGVMMEGRGLSR